MFRVLRCDHLYMICSVRFLIDFAGSLYSSWVTGWLIVLHLHGAYIDRPCSICSPNTVALYFLGMHLHPYSQK